MASAHGRVHRRAERAVQHQPPVAQLVAEPLQHQRAVIGHVTRGLPLVGQIAHQVRGGQLVQAVGAQPRGGVLLAGAGQLAAVRAERPAELHRPSRGVAVPERQLARLARRGGDQHLVGGDVLDPPGTGAEHEHVADPRLVDHFLVELTDAVRVPPVGLPLRRGQEHAEQAAVRDGAAAGHRQPLRSRAAVQHAGGAVPDQPRAQLGELLAGIAARQHVEHRFQDRPGQAGERGGPPDHPVQLVHVPVVHRGHGHDLLGEHVERVARDAQLLDLATLHPPRDHRRLHQVPLVLGEDHAAGHVTDVVPGPAGALQPAGHRRRRFHLDHQIHRAHVDAQFQAGGGDHGGQPPGLERLLDLGPFLPGHRPVVRPGHLGGRARRWSRPGP